MKPTRTSSETDVRSPHFQFDKKPKSVHFTRHLSKSLHDIPENSTKHSDFSSQKMLSSIGSSMSSREHSRSSEDLLGKETWHKQEKFQSCSSLSTLPCFDDTEAKDIDDFTPFWSGNKDKKANVRIGSVFDGEKQIHVQPFFPVEHSLQTTVEMTSEETDRNIDIIEVAASVFPRQYVKKSVEVEKSADQVIRSVEKSVALIDNFIPVCTGNERFIEIGIRGSLNTSNTMKIELMDNASQTVETTVPEHEADKSTSVIRELKDDAVQATEFWDQFKEENDKKIQLTLVDSAVQTITEELDEKYLVRTDKVSEDSIKLENEDSSELEEVIEEACQKKFAFQVGNGEADKGLSDDDSLVPSGSHPDEFVLEGDIEKNLENLIIRDEFNLQNGEISSTDLEVKDDLDANISEINTEEEKDESLQGLDDGSSLENAPLEIIEPPVMETVLEEQNGEFLEAMKNRVCEREQQVQHLQQEILKLDDANLQLQQEQMQLFRFSSVQSLGSEDDSQFLEPQKDPVSLAREIDSLRIQVGNQERARSSLEWEVQALRERLDNNDPAEVAQLIEEMRSLREELSSLTTKNKDLYDEIVKLREENTVLKRERCRNGSHLNQRRTTLQEDIQSNSKLKGNFINTSNNETKSSDESRIKITNSVRNVERELPSSRTSVRKKETTIVYFPSKHKIANDNKISGSAGISGFFPLSGGSSNSESDSTQYQELPFAARKPMPNVKIRKPDAGLLLDTGVQTSDTEWLKVHFPEDNKTDLASDNKRSFGVQTTISAVEKEDSGPQARTESDGSPYKYTKYTKRNKTVVYSSSEQGRRDSTNCGRRYTVQEPTYFSSVQDRFHTDSGSSTDSLLDEADELVRKSMEKIIDGIYDRDKQSTASRRESSRKKLSFAHESPSRPRTSTPRRGEDYSYIPSHPDSPSLSSSASYSSTSPFIPKSPTDLIEGYRVRFMHPRGGMEEGIVRYVGSISGKQDTMIGIELAHAKGDSNGMYNGTKYFTCEMNKGIFISLRKVILVWPQQQ